VGVIATRDLLKDPQTLAIEAELLAMRHGGVPVAAPSANRFGHVSPTAAAHVIADLGHCDSYGTDRC
jgi:L-threonylcarbamoyladenylate synthase